MKQRVVIETASLNPAVMSDTVLLTESVIAVTYFFATAFCSSDDSRRSSKQWCSHPRYAVQRSWVLFRPRCRGSTPSRRRGDLQGWEQVRGSSQRRQAAGREQCLDRAPRPACSMSLESSKEPGRRQAEAGFNLEDSFAASVEEFDWHIADEAGTRWPWRPGWRRVEGTEMLANIIGTRETHPQVIFQSHEKRVKTEMRVLFIPVWSITCWRSARHSLLFVVFW